MFQAFAALFNAIISFLSAAETVGKATEEVAATLEARARLYRKEEEAKIAAKEEAFLASLEKKEQ